MSEVMQKYFDAKPESVDLAREFATSPLTAWGLDGPAEDNRLCISELASNALAHGSEPGHGFLARLAVDDDFVRVEVHDSRSRRCGDQRPQVHHPTSSETSGRGLLIVETLADGWGVEDRQPLGKRFKAVPALREAAC
ncbi:ATP-binding protein [Streptomyces sp. NBC_01803]|uniref:ATP-binding protein n=1 Tax=Streptomyces sp. NBC_01803 TaxID=2975946 RepID=UPI002DD94C91|nr:ATP-binding protein [Streptomyces sp. NBC_01803]WSA46198.1 ATP-binding protein [Streptomyces sp. NBC_01803]